MNELSKNVVVDDAADIATIYGTKISGGLLRAMCVPTKPGEWFRIIKTVDGVATVEWKMELGWWRTMLGHFARIRTPLLRHGQTPSKPMPKEPPS